MVAVADDGGVVGVDVVCESLVEEVAYALEVLAVGVFSVAEDAVL